MLTGTGHEEDQPSHLRVATLREYVKEWYGDDSAVLGAKDLDEAEAGVGIKSKEERKRSHVQKNVEEYAGLLGRACPAGVYEYVDVDEVCKLTRSLSEYADVDLVGIEEPLWRERRMEWEEVGDKCTGTSLL